MNSFCEFMKTTIPPIPLENIEKVFLPGEVETRVLSGVNHEIHHGDSVDKEGSA
jgi:hypothetical protein